MSEKEQNSGYYFKQIQILQKEIEDWRTKDGDREVARDLLNYNKRMYNQVKNKEELEKITIRSASKDLINGLWFFIKLFLAIGLIGFIIKHMLLNMAHGS